MNQQPKHWKILLIGDSCIDEYRLGAVDRLSPEAPVPVIRQISVSSVPGMAANVLHNLENLGLTVDFVTNTERIIKTRYIDQRSGQHLLRVDNEPRVESWDGETPLSITDYDAVIISDYNKGFLTYNQMEWLVSNAQGPVFIDTKKPDLARFHGAIVKINELEYRARYSSNDTLIVTLGARGAMLKRNNQELVYGTETVEVMDVCGCGDTFLASLAYQYLRTDNLADAIVFANRSATLTVQHRGNYAPKLEEII